METQQMNKSRNIKIEKVVLSCGGVKEELEKEFKLLKKISKKQPTKKISRKRIPGFSVRPGLEVGCMVTLRGKEAGELLGRLLSAIDNQLSKKQIADNHFSFGIKEYIEIPGEEYDREIGIIGFKITVVFSRHGKRVQRKNIKKGKLPEKQKIPREEIIKFMEDNFQTEIE